MCTLHYLCLVNTITTLIWQNFVSLFYNRIVYFTTKMSWSNCPLLRFSFLTQIIVCIIHSWFKSKSVQNNFKVAQVWFVFLFAQKLSRNDQLSRTKEKTNYKFKIILIWIHFHLHVPIQHEHLNSCTNTAGLFSGSPVLWNCEI